MDFKGRIKLRLKGQGSSKTVPGSAIVNPENSSIQQFLGAAPSSGYSSSGTTTAVKFPSISPNTAAALNNTTAERTATLASQVPRSLWLEAFDSLKLKEPDLVEDYCRILLNGATNSSSNPANSTLLTTNMMIPNEKLIQLAKERSESFIISPSKIGGKTEKVVKVIITAKSIIASAFEAEPHAAIAWAGISVILPLLVNPVTEKEGCRNGLEIIPHLIHRYSIIDKSLTGSQPSDQIRLDLATTMVQLYTSILLYEARAIVQYCGHGLTRYIRDALKLNGWMVMHKDINDLDQRCRYLIDTIDGDFYRRAIEQQNTKWTSLEENTTILLQKMDIIANDIKEEKTWRRTKETQECHQSFRFKNLYELQKDRNPSRVPRTCNWVLEHPSFIDWREGNSSGLLWISADPGCGKSVLSKALVEERLVVQAAQASKATVCYFFFKDVSPEQRSPTKAISALLHQIFSSQEHLLAHAMPSWERNKNDIANLPGEMWKILGKIASDPGAEDIICILDALDECDNFGEKIIAGLKLLYPGVQQPGAHSGMRFLVTSRPYYDIDKHFEHFTSNFPRIRLSGETESEKITGEINLVIDSEVKSLDLPEKVENHLLSRLKSMENRTYLWLHLIMDTIRQRTKASKRSKTLDKIFESPLPTNIYEAYEAILNRSLDIYEARRLLHLVVAAERPLSLDELNIALHIEERYDGNQSFEDIELEDSILFPQRIRNICGLFLFISNRRVYLIHQTAREFLVATSNGQVSTDGWKHSLDPHISRATLNKACIAYLSLRMFSDSTVQCFRDELGGDLSIVTNDLRFAFLECSSFWWHYFDRVVYADAPDVVNAAVELCTHPVRRRRWAQACLLSTDLVEIDKFVNKVGILVQNNNRGRDRDVMLVYNVVDDHLNLKVDGEVILRRLRTNS